MADPRIDEFEKWSKARGKAGVGSARRRIAQELFDIAGKGTVLPAHVDALLDKYHAKRAGPPVIKATREVAEDVLAWQKDAGPPLPGAHALLSQLDDLPGMSHRPPAPHGGVAIGEEMPIGASEPPPPPEDDLIDRAPKAFKKGFDRTPSVRPQAAGIEVDLDEIGVVHGRGVRRSEEIDDDVAVLPGGSQPLSIPPPPEPPPAAGKLSVAAPPPGPPIGSVPSASLSAATDEGAKPGTLLVVPEPKKGLPRNLVAGIAAGVLVVVGVVGLLLSPWTPLTSKRRPIEGSFSSKHLGVSLTLGNGWAHDESRDGVEVKEGWDRRSSVFFKGDASTDFQNELLLTVYSSSARRATDADAKRLGVAEATGARDSDCAAFSAPGGESGTVCTAVVVSGGHDMAAVDAYFALDGRAVFARFLAAGGADEAAKKRALDQAKSHLESLRSLP